MEESVHELESTLKKIKPFFGPKDSIEDINLEWIDRILLNRIYSHHDRALINKLPNLISRIFSGHQQGSFLEIRNFRHQLEPLKDSFIRDATKFTIPLPNIIYSPILRGMRPLAEEATDKFISRRHLYEERTLKDYKNIKKEQIFTGEKIYETLKEHLLGLPDQRKIVNQYESLLSRYFFDNKEVSLIPKHDHDVVNILIEGEDQLPLFEVGDGLQQIIMMTFTSFFAKEKSIICIEEPEISLHPGLIRQLVKFLIEETNHQFFVTTHSNHLLDFHDQSSKCSLFKLTKSVVDKKFHIHKIGKDRSILFDLGVKSSSVFISNCTIWVEGITDRLYIREFLRRYLKEKTDKQYIENYHFSFVEYQGGNLTHWEFIDEIDDELEFLKALDTTSAPFLIADGDIEGKGNRAVKLSSELGENFFLLSAKEIENYLPKDVIVYACKKLFDTFRRDTFGLDIGGIDNIDYEIYRSSDEGIGHHIDKVLGCTGKQSIFSSESTTLKDKLKFCTYATEYMKTNDWELTPEINHLCEKIVNHIQRHNS